MGERGKGRMGEERKEGKEREEGEVRGEASKKDRPSSDEEGPARARERRSRDVRGAGWCDRDGTAISVYHPPAPPVQEGGCVGALLYRSAPNPNPRRARQGDRLRCFVPRSPFLPFPSLPFPPPIHERHTPVRSPRRCSSGTRLTPNQKEKGGPPCGEPPFRALRWGVSPGPQRPIESRRAQSTGMDSARRALRSPGPGSSLLFASGASPRPRARSRLSAMPLAT